MDKDKFITDVIEPGTQAEQVTVEISLRDGRPLSYSIDDATYMLRNLISGAWEDAGRDSGISEVIRLLDHLKALQEIAALERQITTLQSLLILANRET